MKKHRRQFKKSGQKEIDAKYRKFEMIQTRRLLSSYGGVGSIIETPNGAILIDDFDNWKVFKDKNYFENTDNHIVDKRFLRRLKSSFEKIDAFVRLPENGMNRQMQPDIPELTTSGRYFPEWMFCPKCKKFDKLSSWLRRWNSTVEEKHKGDFHPPKCPSCYKEARDKGLRKRFFELEQTRFILTSPNGNIADIPWDRWVLKQAKGKSEDAEKYEEAELDTEYKRFLDFEEDIPKNTYYFEYSTSDKLSDMKGISVIAKNAKTNTIVKQETLSGIFSLRVPEWKVLPDARPNNSWMKVVIRSSNSVYYPNSINSLRLPWDEKEVGDMSLENDYRKGEFNFISAHKEREEYEEESLVIDPVEDSYYADLNLKQIFSVDSLKMTSVQLSFTRQEPLDKAVYLDNDEIVKGRDGQAIQKKYTSKYGINTRYLPAVENYGEGIFIEFDREQIDEWCGKYSQIQERVTYIQTNYDNTKLNINEQREISAKFILIHTFAHLFIKELEFLSGYPATSMHERLYVDDEMQGVLIF